MNLLNKLTLKNLKLNKKRTIVTIIGIMLSVALITAVTAMYFSANASLIKFETREKGNYHYVFQNVEKDDINRFEENRNIESYYLTQDIGYANLPESKNDYKPYIFIKAFDTNALKNLGINLVSGRLPEKENEIVIPTHLKTSGRVTYNIGDTLTLEVGKRVADDYELTQQNSFIPDQKEEIVDTTEREYKIVGIIERPTSTIESYSAPGFTFITLLKEDEITNKVDIYTRYTKEALKKDKEVTADILGVDRQSFITYYEGTFYYEDIDKIESEMSKAKYGLDNNGYLITLETGIFASSSMQELGIVVIIVIGIIIFTSVFCIKNSFDISITEKTKQYGMLSSIGATSKQIKKNVYYEAFLLGCIGIPLGIACGLLASYILIIISNFFLKELISGMSLIYAFSIYPILFAIILGLVTLYLSAWKSAHHAAKISPIKAIRNSGDIKINSKKIKSPHYIKKIFGIGGEISYKNLKRNKKKYRTTVISIIVCVSVFIALSSFINLAFTAVKKEFASTDYNIQINYDIMSDDELSEKMRKITSFDNIEEYTILTNSTISQEKYKIKWSEEYLKYFPDVSKKEAAYIDEDESGNEVEYYETSEIGVFAIDKDSYKKYIDELGLNYEDIKDKGILINYAKLYVPDKQENDYVEKTISLFGYKVGDTLNWKTYYNGTTEKDTNITIGAITNKLPFGIKNSHGYALMIVSEDLYHQQIKETSSSETILIYTKNASKLQDEIDEYAKDFDYSLQNTEEQVQMMKSFYTLIAIFLYGFITVIALIGVTNIFNTITTNMELRSKEFATLKSIGMTTKEFNHMIRLESFFYGTKALVIGIPIGCILSYFIYYYLTESDASSTYTLPYNAIVISILAVFILITCIMKFSINKINKQNTIETIRNENI